MDALSSPVPFPFSPPLSDLAEGLEEVCAAGPRDMAAALGFSLSRILTNDLRPALLVAQRMRQQLAQTDALMQASAARRRDHDVLAVLGGLSNALPGGAVVQRLEWRGKKLHITGYAPNGGGLVSALRKLPFLTDVESDIPEGGDS